MTETLITLAIAATLGGLWYASGRIGQPRPEWEAVLALPGDLRAVGDPPDEDPWRTAPAASNHRHPIPGAQRACACGGRRCRAFREGRECRWDREHEPAAYAAGHPLPRDGRHSAVLAAVRWLAGPQWETGELPIVRRLELGRLVGAVRPPMLLAGPRRLP